MNKSLKIGLINILIVLVVSITTSFYVTTMIHSTYGNDVRANSTNRNDQEALIEITRAEKEINFTGSLHEVSKETKVKMKEYFAKEKELDALYGEFYSYEDDQGNSTAPDSLRSQVEAVEIELNDIAESL